MITSSTALIVQDSSKGWRIALLNLPSLLKRILHPLLSFLSSCLLSPLALALSLLLLLVPPSASRVCLRFSYTSLCPPLVSLPPSRSRSPATSGPTPA
eukprot:747490-Hanusia_phi.AAC.1